MNPPMSRIAAGDRVVLKNDPQRGGWATDEREERGGRIWLLVQMDTGRRERIPEDQLERVGAGADAPLDLLKAGKASAPNHLRRALLHLRLFGRLADMIYSMEATNTDFYPHQFKPVLKLLRSPAQGILIADEVGLGKTIEAGLIWTELRARYELRRLLVFCPAVLREKWRAELELKMGLHPRVCQNAREVLDVLQNGEHRARGFALICGQQALRPPRKPKANDARVRLSEFLDAARDWEEPPIDLLVIDEAQHIRNPESRTHIVARRLRGASRYAAFLSATPLANKNRDMFELLHLLDEGAFEYERDFENMLDANQPVVELRDRALRGEMTVADFRAGLARARAHPLLQNSEQLSLLEKEPLTDAALARPETRARLAERLEHANLLGHVVTRTRKKDIGTRATREVVDQIVPMTPAEREAYELVTREIATAARLREGPAEFFLMTPQRQMASCIVSALNHWRSKTEDWEAAEWDDEDDGEDGGAVLAVAAEVYHRNRQRLDDMEPRLRADDSKYKLLVKKFDEHFRGHPPEKAIVFSTYPGTLEYLRARLAADRPQWGSVVLRGGGTPEDKADLVRRFREDDHARILLSSEVGGEGIDLQFCRMVVNYDMPWNPMRLEQRIGRVDRIGQQSDKIIVWNLLHRDTIDERIYQAVDTKRWLERRALGDAEAVIAKEFRELTRELLLGGLSPKQKKQRLEAARMAVANSALAAERLEEEAAHLIAHGDYLLRQIQDARDQHHWITPEDLAAYVDDFLRAKCAGSVFQRMDGENRYEAALSFDAIVRFRQFIRERKIPYEGGFLWGDRPAKICFGGHRSLQRGVELVTHAHPLIKFAAHETGRGDDNLRPVIAAKLSGAKLSGAEPGTYVIAGALWKFESGPMRVEKIAYAGARVADGRVVGGAEAESIAVAAAKAGAYWPQWRSRLSGEAAHETARSLLASLEHARRPFFDGLKAEAADRAEIQLHSVRRQTEREEDSIRKAIATLREKGRERMIPLQERRLEIVRHRLRLREHEIKAALESIRDRPAEMLFVAVVLVA